MRKKKLCFKFSKAVLEKNGSNMSKHSPKSTQFPYFEVYQVQKHAPSAPLYSQTKNHQIRNFTIILQYLTKKERNQNIEK